MGCAQLCHKRQQPVLPGDTLPAAVKDRLPHCELHMERAVCQGPEGSQEVAGNPGPGSTADQQPSPASNHVGLEVDPSPVQPPVSLQPRPHLVATQGDPELRHAQAPDPQKLWVTKYE